MFINCVVGEFRIAFRADCVPRFFQRTATGSDLLNRTIGALDEIAGVLDGGVDHFFANQRIPTAGRNGVHVEGGDVVQRVTPIGEVTVAAIAGRVVFHDVAGEHDVLVGYVNHYVAGGMGATQMHQVDATVAQIDGHVIAEGSGGVGQARNRLMAFEQAREPLELAVPVFLSALHHHRAGGVAHDDLVRAISAGPQYANRVIVSQDHVANRFVRNGTHTVDHLLSKTRGGLRLDNHHTVVSNDHSRVRVTFRSKGVEPVTDLVESNLLFRHVALRRERFCHRGSP